MWSAAVLCYRTDVLDHRIEVYNGRAGAGMGKVQGTSGACIEFDHARFRLSSCEGKAKDDFRACQGFEGLEVLMRGLHGWRSSDLGLPDAWRAQVLWSCEEELQAASQEPGARRADQGRLVCARRVKGWQDAARAFEAQARRPPPTHAHAPHASDYARASQSAR